MDYNSLKVRGWIFIGYLVSQVAFSAINASNFDSTEYAQISEHALVMAGLLFGSEVLKRK